MFQHFEVSIANNMNETGGLMIAVHCKSADDDLGEHYLWKDQDLRWKFRINLFRSTLFFCSVNSGETTLRFDVFDTDYISFKCQDSSKCFWSVRDEGFYLSCDGSTFEKQHEWPSIL
ncbi:hypothetical protein M569_16794 [Genlisea aurea]|uniref:S-protein homolog n=1 Tax=Genlisea aurea TaxID=192259 RepID=S8BUG6_9LAMI|nr:hypothetical protein M569_16794 [Genlisea aurea]